MGDRGQVRLISQGDPDIYLYTHWGATSLPGVVADALARGRDRWGDDEYLNRIIFSEMIKGEVMKNTGYGIGTALHSDTWLVVEVDHTNKTVAIKELAYDDWTGSSPEEVEEWVNSSHWKYEAEPTQFELFVAEHSII